MTLAGQIVSVATAVLVAPPMAILAVAVLMDDDLGAKLIFVPMFALIAIGAVCVGLEGLGIL